MKINRAYLFRIFPTMHQLAIIWVCIHCARAIYNIMLAAKIDYYKRFGTMLYCTPAQFKDEYPWLKEADSLALVNAQLHLETAFRNFFRDPKVGFPKFKKRSACAWKYTTNVVGDNITLANGYLRLPKVGAVKIKQHRPVEGKIKSVTIEITRTGKVFVSILTEREIDVEDVSVKDPLGLDYSSPHLYVDSNGNRPEFEKVFSKYQDKLAHEQKKLSEMYRAAKAAGRDLSECRNYQKQKLVVARIHEKIANCRKDMLHKLSHAIAENYDAVAAENLDMKALSQCLNLGKSTMDNGYGMFLRMLEYKLAERGKKLILIDKWYPSTKICSGCGNVKSISLDERTYVCPNCGMVMDRDVNAAINIRNEALRMLSA